MTLTLLKSQVDTSGVTQWWGYSSHMSVYFASKGSSRNLQGDCSPISLY